MTKRKRTPGRRFFDKRSVQISILIIAVYTAQKFPNVDFFAEIMELSLDIANYIKTTIDALGGVVVLTLLFQIYKWIKERNENGRENKR